MAVCWDPSGPESYHHPTGGSDLSRIKTVTLNTEFRFPTSTTHRALSTTCVPEIVDIQFKWFPINSSVMVFFSQRREKSIHSGLKFGERSYLSEHRLSLATNSIVKR